GGPDDGTDPEAPDNAEFYVGLKPREEWTTTKDREALIEKMRAALLAAVPGITTNFSQPIKDNVDEALAGVKGELAIKLYGRDVFTLNRTARDIAAVLQNVRGVADLGYDTLIGLPQLQIVVDRASTARHGINIQDVQDVVEAATKGRVAIKWSVRERDMGSLVKEAMQKVEAGVRLPPGYQMVWSGRFEDQQRALAKLYVVVPLVVFIIFILLFGTFQSVGDALLIMLNLPFAVIGGTLALYFWGTNFN